VIIVTLVIGVAAVLALNLVGPGQPPATPAPESHGHPPGPHGGSVVAIDRDNHLHAEAAIDGGLVRLYLFGRELTEVRPVVARTLCAAVRLHDGEGDFALMLRPEPLETDPPGTASRFAGRLSPALWRGHPRLVVWSLPVEEARFRFEIELAHSPLEEAEVARAEADEAALYATPKGKYLADDVRRNGTVPASRKYRGERPSHDDRPAPGERVCPVSRERVDARFVWVIGGKEYRFCCPPCIDEYVATAKERPDEVKEPEFYLHR
jgi:YHS domain-containing protein